jgi:SAM-dependent methyltransferase
MTSSAADFYSKEYFLGQSDKRGEFSLVDLDAKFYDRTQTVIEYFGLEHSDPGRIVEAGCGTAPFYRVIRTIASLEHIDIICSDITDNGVKLLDNNSRPPFVLGGAEKLPFETGSVGGVVLWDILEHIAHPELALREAHRVLKSGGFVHIISPNPSSWLRDASDSDNDPYRRDKSHIFPPIVTVDFLDDALSQLGFKYEIYTRGFQGSPGQAQQGIKAMKLAEADSSGSHIVVFARKL